MDTIIFVKDRNWPGTNSRIYEISSADLGRKAMTSWSRIEDMQAAGYSLPGEALQNRYFALSNRDDATQAEWDEFIDALWNVVHSMTPEALADRYGETMKRFNAGDRGALEARPYPRVTVLAL